jgi:hypothetical protein
MAPYIAIDTMMYAATDTPPSATGVAVSCSSRRGRPMMTYIMTGKAIVKNSVRRLRRRRLSSMPR